MSNGSSEWAFLGRNLCQLRQVVWNSTRCGKPVVAAPFYSTLPTAASSGICASFHTWCWLPPPDHSSLSKQPRSVSHTDATHQAHGWFWSRIVLLLICLHHAWMTHTHLQPWSLASIIISMESVCLIDKQGITHRQMSTVIANWPPFMSWTQCSVQRGGDCITAITFSSGSQCAYRFCPFFSSFG